MNVSITFHLFILVFDLSLFLRSLQLVVPSSPNETEDVSPPIRSGMCTILATEN
jgi:hypothetical protein